MSSFSSVVRKPGQKIAPKVAPRRQVQRHSLRATTAASTLTPESLHQSPAPQTAPSQAPVDPDVQSRTKAAPPPTPSPTAEDATTVQLAARNRRLETTPDATSPEQSRESTVPDIQTSNISPNADRRRRGQSSQQDAAVDHGSALEGAGAVLRDMSDAVEPPLKRRRLASSGTLPITKISEPQQRVETALNVRPALGTDELLQQVQSGARAVSELANSIDTRTRDSRSRTARRSPDASASELDESASPGADKAATTAGKLSRNKSNGRTRYRRGHTPEDAAQHKIDEKTTSLKDLLKDSGLGLRSGTGIRLDNEWTEIKARWDQKLEQNRAKAKLKAAQRKAARGTHPLEGEEEITGEAAPPIIQQPQFAVVDGVVQLLSESTGVDLSRNLDQRAKDVLDADIQKDERIYNYVNQNRIGKKAGLRVRTKWNSELNDKFFQGLRMFGTDFELIANFFGGDWTRRQIKAKFVREERADIVKIKEALAGREQINLDSYGALVDGGITALRDPKDIQAELDAEEQRIIQEYEKAKNGDQFGVDEAAERPVESIETEIVETVETEQPRETPSDNRFSTLADKVVRQATRPSQSLKKQPQRKQREQTGTSKAGAGGRKGARGKKPLEGVEERIGNIGDVDV